MSLPQDSSTPVFGRSIGREVDRDALSGTSRKLDLEGSPRKPNPGDDFGTSFAEKAQRHLVIADHHLARRKPRQAAAGDMAAGSESGCEDDAPHWAVQLENLEARLETRLVTLMAGVMEDIRKMRTEYQESPKHVHSTQHDIKRELEAQRMEISEQQASMKESIRNLQQTVTELKAEQQKQLTWVKAELEQRLKQILPSSTNRSRSPVVRSREEATSVTAAPGSARGSSARGSSTEGRASMKTPLSAPKSPVLRARGGLTRPGPVVPQADVIWAGNDRGPRLPVAGSELMRQGGRRHQSASPKRPGALAGFLLPCGPAPGAAEPPTPRSSAPNLRTRAHVYRTPPLPHRDLREISTSRTAVSSLPQSAGTGSPQSAVRSVR